MPEIVSELHLAGPACHIGHVLIILSPCFKTSNYKVSVLVTDRPPQHHQLFASSCFGVSAPILSQLLCSWRQFALLRNAVVKI